MISYKQYLREGAGGSDAGKFELTKFTLQKAKAWIESQGFDLNQIPKFDSDFKYAQRLAKKGHTKRKDMPVISSGDIDDFMKKLNMGFFSLEAPYIGADLPKTPVNAKIVQAKVKKLKPIQEQIYFDKSMGGIIKNGMQKSIAFLTSKIFVISSDFKILDGHHRWLSSVIIDEELVIKALQIDLPMRILLPLSLAYSDYIGNKRNK